MGRRIKKATPATETTNRRPERAAPTKKEKWFFVPVQKGRTLSFTLNVHVEKGKSFSVNVGGRDVEVDAEDDAEDPSPVRGRE